MLILASVDEEPVPIFQGLSRGYPPCRDDVYPFPPDRLTRSLGDFAKIVEVFDNRGVSFVSVTQAFNTTTSMGRFQRYLQLDCARL